MANVGTMIVHNTKKVNPNNVQLFRFEIRFSAKTKKRTTTKIEYFANGMNERNFAVQ